MVARCEWFGANYFDVVFAGAFLGDAWMVVAYMNWLRGFGLRSRSELFCCCFRGVILLFVRLDVVGFVV